MGWTERRSEFEEPSLVHFQCTGILGRFEDRFSGRGQPPAWRRGPGLSGVLLEPANTTLPGSRAFADVIGVAKVLMD